MTENTQRKVIDKFAPIKKFIHQEKAGGIVLGISVLIALFLANSFLAEDYFHFLEHTLGLYFDHQIFLEYNIHEWINDGLMAIFFFVIGIELKREFISGEFKNLRNAILPVSAAIGGMIVPALIFLILNPTGEPHQGWGIPMATDIAFSLGVLYLLGNRIPLSLKVFLTALAIVDDLGAVLVIAFFYTSEISISSLFIGLGFVFIMFIGNRLGIRSLMFYAILGIGGVWIAFLLSGIHATIASVLAAFTIPANVKISEAIYVSKMDKRLEEFKSMDPNGMPTLTEEQLHTLENIKEDTNDAIPPLQRLEYAIHPIVTFIIIPIFALANAGISLDIDMNSLFSNNIALGVGLGLLLGKVIGVMGGTLIAIKLKLAQFPEGMNIKNLLGIGLLAGIGFTMSLFITSLAFNNPEYINQAKIGILISSIISGILGYIVLAQNNKAKTS